MERLTERFYEDGLCYGKVNCEDNCTYCDRFLKVLNKLADYEDAEEQGYCYRFPCKVGDMVYFHWHVSDGTTIVYPAEVKEIRIGTYMLRKGIMYRIEPRGYAGKIRIFYHSDWGYCIFKTKEEADQALAALQKG